MSKLTDKIRSLETKINAAPFDSMKNIGSTLLPSSSPEILRPIPFQDGELVVIPDETADTYRLCFILNGSKSILASHPNGFSCHSLAKRIVAYSANSPDKEARLSYLEQAEYIILCGGSVDFIAINTTRLSKLLNQMEARRLAKEIGQTLKRRSNHYDFAL